MRRPAMRIRMDWRSVKFDWNRARAFLVTGEEGSLSAAARALQMAQPTLGRQVAALEEELGVALFTRTGRGLSLTPTGLDLLAHVREMGEAATRVSRGASGHSEEVAGPICLTASEMYAATILPPVVARLRQTHPGIEVEVVASNEVRDLRRREADIAIRNARPLQNDLIARKVADDRGTLYAADDYLDRIGRPGRPEDFSDAEFVGFTENSRYIEALAPLGFSLTLDNFPVVSDSHLVQWELVKAGAGIGVAPVALGDATRGVSRILSDLPTVDFPVWLVAHRDLSRSRRMRIVFDLMAEAFAETGR